MQTLEDAIRERYSYDPETGEIKHKRLKRVVGTVTAEGYLQFFFRMGSERPGPLAHRAAWLLHSGSWPDGEIDHINGIKTDNRMCNLRVVTRSENAMNRSVRRDTKCGLKGVQASGSKFVAKLCRDGRSYYVGTFDTAEQASEAYKAAAALIHGEFARAA